MFFVVFFVFFLPALQKSLLVEVKNMGFGIDRQTDMEMRQDTSTFRAQFSHHKIESVPYSAFVLIMEFYIQRLRD